MRKTLALIFAGGCFVLSGCTYFDTDEQSIEQVSTQEEKQETKQETPAQSLPKSKEVERQPVTTTLAAAGDIMLSRWVGVKIRWSGDNAHPFKNVAESFAEADIAFANLESPFNNTGSFVTEGMSFKAEPEFIEGLTLSGFDMLSLANNHFGNEQRAGMKFTFSHLGENNIGYCGAGNNSKEAHTIAIIERNGIVFGFLCYNGIAPKSAEAGEDLAGHAWARPEEVKADIEKYRDEVDAIIISMHHGTEYTPKPNAAQIEFAHAAIDAGAETVIGHHPHVVQEVEKYKDKLIVYSLGNLVFDQMWSRETREGVIANYQFKDNRLEKIDFDVVIIDDYHLPRFATEDEAKPVLARMGLNEKTFK